MSNNTKLGNPAVVGLAGFATTTFVLQMHNFGFAGIGAVLILALTFGGIGQFIAGFLEFKTGNNFGFCAFVAYGSFWVAFFLIFVFKHFEMNVLSTKDIGWFLCIYFIFTSIMVLPALKKPRVTALIFITLALGFFGLTLKDLFGIAAVGPITYIDLLVCSALVYYEMASILMGKNKEGVDYLPLGEAILKD